MRKLILSMFLFSCFFAAKSQEYSHVTGMWEYDFFKIDSALRMPTDTISSALVNSMAIKNGVVYFKASTGIWMAVGSAGAGATWGVNIGGIIGAQTDLINLLNLKVNAADTAHMLSFYALKANVLNHSDSAALLFNYLLISSFTKSNLGIPLVVNGLQVINAGNFTSEGIGPFASLPSYTTGPTMYFASDSLFWLYNTGSGYARAAGGGGGGGGDDSVLMASKHFVALNYYPLTGNPSQFLTDTSHVGVLAAIGFTPYSATNPAGYISANQSITFAYAGDIGGTGSGSTAITPSATVTGLKGAALPSLATGNLRYNSGWSFDNTHYYSFADTPSLLATQYYVSTHAGAGNTNSNVGAFYRFAIPNSNNIKTAANGTAMKLDSTTNTNAITFNFDSTYSTGFHTQGYNDVRYRKSLLDSIAGGLYVDTTHFIYVGAPGVDTAVKGRNDSMFVYVMRDSAATGFHIIKTPDGGYVGYIVGAGGGLSVITRLSSRGDSIVRQSGSNFVELGIVDSAGLGVHHRLNGDGTITLYGDSLRFYAQHPLISINDTTWGIDTSGGSFNAAWLQGTPIVNTAPTTGQVLQFNGTAYAPVTFVFYDSVLMQTKYRTDTMRNDIYAAIAAGGGSSNPFADNTNLIKNSTDATKILRFYAGNQTTSTITTDTLPVGNTMLAGTDLINTFTQNQVFNGKVLTSTVQSLTGPVTISAAASQYIKLQINGVTKDSTTSTGTKYFSNYGSGTNTGTAAFILGISSAGEVIETPVGTGSGIALDSIQVDTTTANTSLTQAATANKVIINPGQKMSSLTLTTSTSFHNSGYLYIFFGGTNITSGAVVTVFNILPGSGLTIVGANPSGGTFNAGDHLLYWKFGNILFRLH